jgi:hypothetical protein
LKGRGVSRAVVSSANCEACLFEGGTLATNYRSDSANAGVPSLRDSGSFYLPTQDSAALRPGLTALPPLHHPISRNTGANWGPRLRGSISVRSTPLAKLKLVTHTGSYGHG